MEMHRIQRMPAPFASLDEINLSRYEILINEPLHDISNHFKNIQEELPHHIPKEEKNECQKYYCPIIQRKRGKKTHQITEKAC